MSVRVSSERPLGRAVRVADRWFRVAGVVTLALLAVTGITLALGREAWRPIFALAHLAALMALLPLGAVLAWRAVIEARRVTGSAGRAAPAVARRYPVVTGLVLLSFVTAGISLANFADGERWVRTSANLSTVAIVAALVAHYLRTAGREIQTATRRRRDSSG